MATTPRNRSDEDATEILPVVVTEASLRAEVDQQIVTAKRYKRSLEEVMDMAMTMALENEDVAASCIYSVPRAGKQVKGPSVRLAEIMATAWGNLRAEKRAGNIEGNWVSGEGVVWDLERNFAVRVVKKRRITNREGVRFSEDMIQNTLNSIASIAYRDAVIACIPRAFIRRVYDEAEKLAVGDIKSLAERRGKAIEFFARYGIPQDRILHAIKRASIAEVTLDDVAALKSLIEDIREGRKEIDDAFPDPAKVKAEEEAAPKSKGATGLADTVQKLAGEVAAKAGEKNATPEQKDRAAKVKEQAAAMTGEKPEPATETKWPDHCVPGKPGCSDDISAKVCSNHAPAGDGELPGMAPTKGGRKK